jgi:hypothetical protein
LPADVDFVFESSAINISWFDLAESHDGPAAVMRLVIDVSDVASADTSDGLGSVYFSQIGPANAGDVKLADLHGASGTQAGGDAMTTLTGEFYVKGT